MLEQKVHLSGPGVTDGANNTGTFNPAAMAVVPGTNVITYEYACPGGPTITTNVNVEVFETPDANIQDILQECQRT